MCRMLAGYSRYTEECILMGYLIFMKLTHNNFVQTHPLKSFPLRKHLRTSDANLCQMKPRN